MKDKLAALILVVFSLSLFLEKRSRKKTFLRGTRNLLTLPDILCLMRKEMSLTS